MPLRSPYQAALDDRLHELHPTLRRYFSVIPEGCVGVGEGVFAEIGTERRWMWPFLRFFERRGVLFAGHARSVRFRIENRTVPVEGSDTGVSVASRALDLPGGVWVMTDSVMRSGSGVVDRLGLPATVAASFEIGVADGALSLTSRAVSLRAGRFTFRLPRWCAPVVSLSEQYEPVSGLQRVDLALTMPVVGRLYGYRGHFSYGIVKERHCDEG